MKKRILCYCEKFYPQYFDGKWNYYIENVDGFDYIVQFNNWSAAKEWFKDSKYFKEKTREHYNKKYIKVINIE